MSLRRSRQEAIQAVRVGKSVICSFGFLLFLDGTAPARGLQAGGAPPAKQATPHGDGNSERNREDAAQHPEAAIPPKGSLEGNRASREAVSDRNLPGSSAAYVSTFRELAEAYAKSGSLSESAAALEAAAARAGAEAPRLFREAAELRERCAEYGQALLDYRAMIELSGASAPDAASIEKHLTYLSLAVASAEERPEPAAGNGLPAGKPPAEAVPQESGRPASDRNPASTGMPIPGGIPLLAVVAELDESLLRGDDGLARLVSAVQQAGSTRSSKLEENPLRSSLVYHIRSYEELLRHMHKHKLLPAGFQRAAGQKLIFPLAGDKDTIRRTARFLSFFGVKYRYAEAKDGQVTVELTLSQSSKFDARRRLLQHMRIDLQDRAVQEIAVTLHDEEMPVVFGAETWARRILRKSGKESRPLLERLLLSPGSLALYTALSSCSESVRAALLSAVPPEELISVAGTLAGFGRYLDFREGSPVFPGAGPAWESLLAGERGSSGGLLARLLALDSGRAATLYAGLASAPPQVQEYFTATPGRLHQAYQGLAPYQRARQPGAGAGTGGQNLARILRQLNASRDRLSLDLNSRFRDYLLPGSKTGTPSSGSSLIHVEPQDVPYLARPGDATVQAHSPVEVVEFLRYLHKRSPEAWNRDVIDSLMTDAPRAPVLTDIVGDLDLEPDPFARYLRYCQNLIRSGDREWNPKRIRTSQAVFYLLSLLRREAALSREDARSLLARALDRMESESEADFAGGVARFLSDDLIHRLPRPTGAGSGAAEAVLRALAGSAPRREFSVEGRKLVYDAADRKMARMRGAILHQRFTPLDVLLPIYDVLGGLTGGKGDARALWAELATKMEGVQTARVEAGTAKSLRQSMAWTDLDALKKTISQVSQGGGSAGDPSRTAQGIAASLHAELGISLLTLCYAYHASPEVDALAFDVNFIRKHDFTDGGASKYSWTAARLESKADRGTYLAGSVSGIDWELARLEVAQSHGAMAGRESTMMPTLLVGFRAIPDYLRTDRAQEFVAHSTRLGREILALASVEPELRNWCDHALRDLLPPSRREQVISLLRQSKPAAAAELVSPSEFYFLGGACLESSELRRTTAGTTLSSKDAGGDAGEPPAVPAASGPAPARGAASLPAGIEILSPNLTRLRQIRQQAERAGEAAVFGKELEQYGMSVRRRLGLRRFTIDPPEPYEYLEQNLREHLLFERMCDLKIQLAELHYALGLSAFFAAAVEEPALREVLSRSAESGQGDWRSTLRRIAQLRKDNVRGWIEEALNRGTISPVEGDAGTRERASSAPAQD